MKKVIVAYVPVLHEGYKLLLEKHADAETLYIFGPDLIEKFDYLAKEIRALAPEEMQKALMGLGTIPRVEILNEKRLKELSDTEIVMPDEDICHTLALEYFKNGKVVFDPIFLRWDRTNTKKEKKVGAEKVITENEFMNSAFAVAEKSSDWWRKIGAVLVKDGKIVLSAVNNHIPHVQQQYADGDPRNASHKGEDLDKYTSVHAEAGIIAEAARKGTALEGAEMYVTDFPCPVCAKQIAFAGIKKLYFKHGYAVLDGERILKQKGVEIVQIEK
jgi:dCMP deaminase